MINPRYGAPGSREEAERIFALADRYGVAQRDIAAQMGITPTAINFLAKGRNAGVRADTLERLATAVNLAIEAKVAQARALIAMHEGKSE